MGHTYISITELKRNISNQNQSTHHQTEARPPPNRTRVQKSLISTYQKKCHWRWSRGQGRYLWDTGNGHKWAVALEHAGQKMWFDQTKRCFFLQGCFFKSRKKSTAKSGKNSKVSAFFHTIPTPRGPVRRSQSCLPRSKAVKRSLFTLFPQGGYSCLADVTALLPSSERECNEPTGKDYCHGVDCFEFSVGLEMADFNGEFEWQIQPVFWNTGVKTSGWRHAWQSQMFRLRPPKTAWLGL